MHTECDLKVNGPESPLKEIGAVFEGMGITTVELAESLRDHLIACPGGKACLEKLIAGIRK